MLETTWDIGNWSSYIDFNDLEEFGSLFLSFYSQNTS